MKKIIKLLAKFSIFDLVIFSGLLISVIFFFLFFYRKSEYVNIRVKSTDTEVLYAQTNPFTWYANQFAPGDTEKDVLGKDMAEIIAVESYNVNPEKKALYLDLRVRALYDSRTKLYSARGKTLIVGTPIKFNFSKVIFDGILTETPETFGKNNKDIVYLKVTALARGINEFKDAVIEPEVIEKIKKNDKIIDSRQNVLLTINDVRLRPAIRVTTTDAGELILTDDPYYKDAILTINIRARKYQSEYFIFDNQPLKIGGSIPINLTTLSIFPVVTEIEDSRD